MVVALLARLVLVSLTPRPRRPHDQVVPLAAHNVVGAVAVRPQVHDCAADHVSVRVDVAAVVGGAEAAAEGEGGAGELAAQTDVQGHVRVVVVHVEAAVLAALVLDHERVVLVKRRALLREEQFGQRQQTLPLEVVDERAHPDLVDDDAVVVHRVRPRHRQPRRLVIRELVEQPRAKVGPEHLEGEDAAGHLLAQHAAQRRLRAVGERGAEAVGEPRVVKRGGEELAVERRVALRPLRRARALGELERHLERQRERRALVLLDERGEFVLGGALQRLELLAELPHLEGRHRRHARRLLRLGHLVDVEPK